MNGFAALCDSDVLYIRCSRCSSARLQLDLAEHNAVWLLKAWRMETEREMRQLRASHANNLPVCPLLWATWTPGLGDAALKFPGFPCPCAHRLLFYYQLHLAHRHSGWYDKARLNISHRLSWYPNKIFVDIRKSKEYIPQPQHSSLFLQFALRNTCQVTTTNCRGPSRPK